jgi:hypothetical protein
MTECDRIRAEAPGLASLRSDDPERMSAMSHARGCAACARALREGERLQSLLVAAEVEPLPVAALERASQAIGAQLRREARRRVVASLAAVSVAVLVFIAFGRARSHSLGDWALAAVLWAIAVAVAAAVSRRPLLVATLSVLASATAALISGAPGPLAPALGIECVVTELASSALVAGAVWFTARAAATSPARSAIIAAACAGALAGDAALQVTCAAHTAVPHLLAFHVGGILLAAAGATLLPRRTPVRAAT